MNNIKADIAQNNYKRIYLLFGEEVYLLRRYLELLKNGVLGGDSSEVNYAHFDGTTGYDVNELKELAVTLPFFAERRLIIAENSGLFKADIGFDTFISEIADSTVLILAETKVDKRTALYKEIKKQGYVCEFTPLQPVQTVEFSMNYVSSAGKRIARSDCEYFVNRVGGDLYNITSELDKVIDYTGDVVNITRNDIDSVCTMQTENRIFDIVDCLIDGNRSEALKMYFDLLSLREQPLGLLRFIQKQYSRLFLVRDEIDRGLSDSEAAANVHISDWQIRKYRSRLKKCRKSYLLRSVELCARTEESIKSGNISDSMGVEILLEELVNAV